MKEPIKYPSIEQFRHAKHTVEYNTQCVGKDANEDPIFDTTIKLPVIAYKGTCKTHGTNASIVLRKNEKPIAQSRERIITAQDDNCGFAKFVDNLPAVLLQQFYDYCGGNVAIYGEWCGKGIQSGVAVSQLDKRFIIFGAMRIDTEQWIDSSGLKSAADNIYNVEDFKTFNIDIDFSNPQEQLDQINKWTEEVENQCPVGAYFNVVGIGEGIVWSPVDPKWQHLKTKLTFKTKGVKHQQTIKKEATIDPVKSASIDEFVGRHVVEDRLNQAWQSLIDQKLELTEKSTGSFIKWVITDIVKEATDELQASGLTQKCVNSAISAKTRQWYFNKINQ